MRARVIALRQQLIRRLKHTTGDIALNFCGQSLALIKALQEWLAGQNRADQPVQWVVDILH
ncbi:hypothetical protein [Pseudomonas helleri]|uniref:hypothetical protein n=1 Tax=Pseudomonas helleri TaxID=1608996 RepID=UPI00389A16DF